AFDGSVMSAVTTAGETYLEKSDRTSLFARPSTKYLYVTQENCENMIARVVGTIGNQTPFLNAPATIAVSTSPTVAVGRRDHQKPLCTPIRQTKSVEINRSMTEETKVPGRMNELLRIPSTTLAWIWIPAIFPSSPNGV